MTLPNRRWPVIVGPTAGGKSALALEVACALNARLGRPAAHILSADSVQIYRGLDIGSAKTPPGERRGVPHHLIDLVGPQEPFTVHDWLAAAEDRIARILSQGGVPIVVGGTHLYVRALLEGMFEGPAADPALREELAALPREERRSRLERIDPPAAQRIHPSDDRRTIRALEVHALTGRPISALQAQWDRGGGRDDAVLVALRWETSAINRRINARVAEMMRAGLLDEVRVLWSAGALGPQAAQALGYKQLIEHLEGRRTLEEAIEAIKIQTRRFAKGQRTWLRRLAALRPETLWLEPQNQSLAAQTARVLELL